MSPYRPLQPLSPFSPCGKIDSYQLIFSLCKNLDLYIISINATLMMSITSNILKTYNNGKRKLNTDDIWLWMERQLIHLRTS